ncbi:LRR receptor serine/threonine-protein kinase [Salix suchowensis]|nr:LRR receptor serine/threonine-protein kinase [Salix suchowensis]
MKCQNANGSSIRFHFFLSNVSNVFGYPIKIQILENISDKLNISNWGTIDQTSCAKAEWWNQTIDDKTHSIVQCNCTFENGSVCHVTSISVKGFNLNGVLPEELGDLPQLLDMSLIVNRLTGPIPPEIGNITTLEELSIDGSELSGKIPEFIGYWINITTFTSFFSFNTYTHVFPLKSSVNVRKYLSYSSSALQNLAPEIVPDLRCYSSCGEYEIGNCCCWKSCCLSGSDTSFVGNLTEIENRKEKGLGCTLSNLFICMSNRFFSSRRISDLSGSSSTLPNLQAMKSLEILILRNCLITGSIPDYIANMSLNILDLSINRLTGNISIFKNLESKTVFLSNNLLTGEPTWALSTSKQADLSYNNFSIVTRPASGGCQEQQKNLNLVSSYLSNNNTDEWCFRKGLPCTQNPELPLFINCGGGSVLFNDDKYEDDLTDGGPASFLFLQGRWGYSTTGIYLENKTAQFLAKNDFNLSVKDVYKTARLAPQSLKYYLHFAEIMYSNDQTYRSLGRRIFDISIQGITLRKNFNIAEKAGGVGIGITEVFDNIIVNGSTIEIHLYWAGKGTTFVPHRGVHGPLISAITVTPYLKKGGLSVGAVIGIVAASCVLAALFLLLLRTKGYLGGKDLENKGRTEGTELRGLDLQTGYFTLRQIKHATNNFDPANKIGEGGFGPVYKGVLSDGPVIAVKQLSSKSRQGNREFVNEIGMISGNQLLLVYEYLENNSLARALFGPEEHQLHLNWQTRKKILLGIAKGLSYLHEESRLKIVHRDIKATNVLLDNDLNAKISDFGLAKLDEEENTHISTRIAGTIGYMAPEYAMRGYLTDKADVYSFGVVALEVVSGKSNTNYRPKEDFVYLLDWAYVLHERNNLLELVDPRLGSSYSKEEAMKMLHLALLCTNQSPSLRPLMSSVVRMLEGNIPVKAPIINHGGTDQEARFKAFQLLSQESQTQVSTSSQSSEVQRSRSRDGPWIDSSYSLPINQLVGLKDFNILMNL